jgi:ATP-binding cassette subfamily B multidrug efflux pump
MFGNQRALLDQESSKPKQVSETLGRLGGYFKKFWYAVVFAITFMIVSTWAQVTTPELTGQVVDCYLAPAASAAFAESPIAGGAGEAAQSNCWSLHRLL